MKTVRVVRIFGQNILVGREGRFQIAASMGLNACCRRASSCMPPSNSSIKKGGRTALVSGKT